MELLYPSYRVYTYPRPSIDRPGIDALQKGEMVPVVNEAGEVTGRMTRVFAHEGDRMLHPVVHLQLLDRLGRIYLQKRSASRKTHPGKWDTAVGGHVSFGEYLKDALYREAEEELGLTLFNPIFLTSYIYESDNERELVVVYASIGSPALKPNPDEVEEGKWWEIEEIEKYLGKSVFTPNFEDEYGRVKDTLTALL